MRVIALFCLIFFTLPARAEVTVFAAASLRGALDEVNAVFDGEVTVSYASSAALARQIAQGAPADVFLSANPDWVAHLDSDPFVDLQAQSAFLGNQLVLIGSATAQEATLGTLVPNLDGRDLATALTTAVPAGIYARQALKSIGIWADVETHLVQTDNVRAALALVSLGEVSYGLVYQTDALAGDQIRVLDQVSPDTHSPILYLAALLTSDAQAADYFAHVKSEAALKVFEAHGFQKPQEGF